MKKLYLILSAYFFYNIALFAQIEDCPETIGGLILGETYAIEFTPTEFSDDIWAMPIMDEDRLIVWVHGLGGQGDDGGDVSISWGQAAFNTELIYKTDSRRPDYSDVSLDVAAGELKGDLEEFSEADANTILIAHSQGSIVSRQVDQYYVTGGLGTEPRTFGGLVTFGGPHQGARILNNKYELADWISVTCSALTAGPVSETIADEFWLDLFLDEEMIKSVFDEYICNAIEIGLTSVLFENYYAGITESFEVGAESIELLNEFTPEIPYVAFYGTETEPLIWHTLVHLLPDHEPNNDITYGVFGSGNDNQLAEWASYTQNQYFSSYTEWKTESDYWGNVLDEWEDFALVLVGWPWIFVEAGFAAEDSEDKRDAYLLGYNWFLDANPFWKSIIGAEEYLIGEEWTCMCINEEEFDLIADFHPIEPGEECNSLWGDCDILVNYDMATKESDGVVLVESASTVNGMVSSREMPGSNHFSMRNDENTEDVLIELFRGDHGDFFITPER